LARMPPFVMMRLRAVFGLEKRRETSSGGESVNYERARLSGMPR